MLVTIIMPCVSTQNAPDLNCDYDYELPDEQRFNVNNMDKTPWGEREEEDDYYDDYDGEPEPAIPEFKDNNPYGIPEGKEIQVVVRVNGGTFYAGKTVSDNVGYTMFTIYPDTSMAQVAITDYDDVENGRDYMTDPAIVGRLYNSYPRASGENCVDYTVRIQSWCKSEFGNNGTILSNIMTGGDWD